MQDVAAEVLWTVIDVTTYAGELRVVFNIGTSSTLWCYGLNRVVILSLGRYALERKTITFLKYHDLRTTFKSKEFYNRFT